jgi:glycosyltransferase involved in cell wall biosynthesis
MTKDRNDNAFMLIELQRKGAELVIIAGKSLGLKGKGKLPLHERMNGIPIHRLYRSPLFMFLFPRRKIKEMLRIAQTFKPDLIFCSQELNMRLALILKKHLQAPVALLVEDAGRISSGEAYASAKNRITMHLFRIPSGPRFWSWLCDKANVLITCHPRDLRILGNLSEHGKPVHYLPWPTFTPDNAELLKVDRKNRGIYVGSLFPFKNTQEFRKTLPLILKETKTKEFIVVGPGPHAKIIESLEKETRGAVKYIPELPRMKALQLIASSYYAYTPVLRGGWGFIGDCWSMRTPIVLTHNDNYVTNNNNALVAENEAELTNNINRLYRDFELYRRLQENGYAESQKRSATRVANKLYNILLTTAQNQKGNVHMKSTNL